MVRNDRARGNVWQFREDSPELNLTSHRRSVRRTHQVSAYSVGLTQNAEALFEIDVGMRRAGLERWIHQFKTLHVQSTGVHRWYLNRLKRKNQHSLLTLIEGHGYPVFYCFQSSTVLEPLRPVDATFALDFKFGGCGQRNSRTESNERMHHHVDYDPNGGSWAFSPTKQRQSLSAVVPFSNHRKEVTNTATNRSAAARRFKLPDPTTSG